MLLRLILLFTIVPLIELVLLVEVGGMIGLPATIGLVVATGVLGAWLARVQGVRTLWRIRDEFAAGRMPAEPLVDGVLILSAGAVLLTPGLVTDACGFLLLLPATRAVVRRWLVAEFQRRVRPLHPPVIDAEWEREE